jgi:hypothetical protein
VRVERGNSVEGARGGVEGEWLVGPGSSSARPDTVARGSGGGERKAREEGRRGGAGLRADGRYITPILSNV